MSYLSLYRKYRSQTFEQVVEQVSTVRILQNAVKYDRIAHAYIFSGPRGTGKTSLARIFAKTISCLTLNKDTPEPCNTCSNCLAITAGEHIDIIEIDAASNTGVDDVRAIIEKVIYRPSLAPYKIYIIDEAHMLSNSAFNALLKTLEEPPAHVVFILATTDPQKLPITIQSRCQKLDFTKISQEAIFHHLVAIAQKESIPVANEAVKLIAKYSGGHMRDAISIFDQVLAFSNGTIEVQNVQEVIGTTGIEDILKIVQYINNQELVEYFSLIEAMYFKGLDAIRFINDIIEVFRSMMFIKLDLQDQLVLSKENVVLLQKTSEIYSKEKLIVIIKKLSAMVPDIRYMEDSKVYVETMLEEIINIKNNDVVVSNVAAKTVEKIEEKPKKFAYPEKKIEPPKPEIKQPEAKVVEKPIPKAVNEEIKPLPLGENIDIVTIKHQWSNLIASLKTTKLRLAAWLMEGIPLALTGNQITVGFKKEYKFHYESVNQDENKQYIMKIFSKLLGSNYSINFRLIEKEENLIDLQNDTFESNTPMNIPTSVKSALSEFGGQLVDE